MISRSFSLLLVVTPLLLACGGSTVGGNDLPAEHDPAVAQALSDQLMVDPDLVGQNEAGAALTGGTDQSIPLDIATPEAVRDAQRQAAVLLRASGADIDLPDPAPLPHGSASPSLMLTDVAERLPDAAECLGAASQSAVWAARLPDALPVYPRGATQDALGRDAPRCALRAVRFTSPVPAQDIAQFYFAQASRAGLGPAYRSDGEQHRIEGGRGSIRFAVHLRPLPSGASEIDLVVVTG